MRKVALLPWALSQGPPPVSVAPSLSQEQVADLSAWLVETLARRLLLSQVLDARLIELPPEAAASPESEFVEASASKGSPRVRAPDPLEPEALSALCREAGCELLLGGVLEVTDAEVQVRLSLVDKTSEVRASFELVHALTEAVSLPDTLAAQLLVALGEDAAVRPVEVFAPLPIADLAQLTQAARALFSARNASALAEEHEAEGLDNGLWLRLSDPSEACADLLSLLARTPALLPARDLLLQGAAAGAHTSALPAWRRALEGLVALRPRDPLALLALGDLRLLLADPDGATALFMQARDRAWDDPTNLRVRTGALSRLSALAEEAGRQEEACGLLRAALLKSDDVELTLRLGLLLRTSAPAEALRMFGRATALDPEDPRPRLELARLVAPFDPARALAEARVAAQHRTAHPEVAREASEFLGTLTAPGGTPR